MAASALAHAPAPKVVLPQVFTNSFDGLDRLKFSAGPVIVIEQPLELPSPSGPVPPVQQAVTNFYDAAGVVLTHVNAIWP